MLSNFQTQTHGKWILAGEHAVIRGTGALVFPVMDKKLTLSYQTSDSPGLIFEVDFFEKNSEEMRQLFQEFFFHALQLLGKTDYLFNGILRIKSTIPAGVGMGASAALCVALARWFHAQGWILADETHHVAQEFEHFFHGKSSGLDIAGVAHPGGIYFNRGTITPLKTTWDPKWQLSFCGQQGPTANSILTVQRLWQTDPQTAQALDELMHRSVEQAKQALEQPYNPKHSLKRLTQAITQAHECFERWGLISEVLKQHIQARYDQGALAVKPTGSGGGGFVVSLWE